MYKLISIILLLSFVIVLFQSCEMINENPVIERCGKDVECEYNDGKYIFSLRYLTTEEAKFLEIINAYRQSQNPPIPPLVSSATLNQAAYDYSELMSETGWFDHTGPDGSTPWERMCNSGHQPACNESAVMGENIAAGYATAEEVFEAWRMSPGHNANMLEPAFKAIGIGVANVEGGVQPWTWTTDFSSIVDVDGCACYGDQQEECQTQNCGQGLKQCVGYCQWSECAPPNAGIEICDGYDNNCDGQVDEGDVCHGCKPVKEVCDDVDNDCDTLVDEENVCGTHCEELPEVCDGNDNDCDGTTDEGCFCPDGIPERECGYDAGICKKGVQRCVNGVWSDCEGAILPRKEICDGFDNNCNGAIDEKACEVDDGLNGTADSGGNGCGCRIMVE